jgi:hypothetical protein
MEAVSDPGTAERVGYRVEQRGPLRHGKPSSAGKAAGGQR